MRNLILLIFLIFSICNHSDAEVRYVSHQGTNTPPYLSWETAADSIMSAINVSSFGDTIYVANGVYEEVVDMIDGLTLIGAGMDSCVIDTRNFVYVSGFYTVKMADRSYITGFNIKTIDSRHGNGIYTREQPGIIINSKIAYNKIQEANYGIYFSGFEFTNSQTLVYKNWITSVYHGISCQLNRPIISNNYVNVIPLGEGIYSSLYAEPLVINNVVTGTNVLFGFKDFGANPKYYNNLLYGAGGYGIDDYGDTIVNNVVYGHNGRWGIGITGAGSYVRNNHIENTITGLYYDIIGGPPPDVKYNNLWNNQTNYQNFTADSTNIYSDPMFNNPDSMDFHLQMYSPLIDKGDPDILDIDGSRSDIGLFGGPNGEKYTYRDLAPRTPVNLSALVDTSNILLTWNKNTEADFSHYNLYRDTTGNFQADSTTFVASIEDTFYLHIIPQGIDILYYKLTAVDNQGNQSQPSEELHIVLTGTDKEEPLTISNYRLYQNYPNPFNPTTRIAYRLKEGGYVKLYVYDIKGELVETLVNKYQEAGYHEVEFQGEIRRQETEVRSLASGIYIYQIIVQNENNIPVFTDMNKMIYLK